MPDDRPLASPVFVDPTGRRRRTVRRAAVAGAAVLIGTMALLVAALLGAPLGPLTPLPEPDSGPPAAVEPVAVPQNTPQTPHNPATSSPTRPANNPVVGPAAVSSTTPPGAPTTTTTVTKGSKPEAPPGRPTGLPTPPGHTR